MNETDSRNDDGGKIANNGLTVKMKPFGNMSNNVGGTKSFYIHLPP